MAQGGNLGTLKSHFTWRKHYHGFPKQRCLTWQLILLNKLVTVASVKGSIINLLFPEDCTTTAF